MRKWLNPGICLNDFDFAPTFRGRIRTLTHYSLKWLPTWPRVTNRIVGLVNPAPSPPNREDCGASQPAKNGRVRALPYMK